MVGPCVVLTCLALACRREGESIGCKGRPLRCSAGWGRLQTTSWDVSKRGLTLGTEERWCFLAGKRRDLISST